MTIVLIITSAFTLLPWLMYLLNRREYRAPPAAAGTVSVSVLIPARNEEASIAACVDAARASVQADLEIIVLDDGSTDRTAAIVAGIAGADPRVRLATAPPLPAGWSGKQHACFELSRLATKPLLCFLDADVRLEPECLARLAAFRNASGAALVSGIPRQETVTFLEKLLLPLIHFILLGFLPMRRMRRTLNPRFGAGCGQVFLADADGYRHTGGHAVIRSSFHDGVKLPRLLRRHGLKSDLCDLTALATCRMYASAGQVWNGLAKNAREGMASPVGLWIWTILLGVGQVLPLWLAWMCAWAIVWPRITSNLPTGFQPQSDIVLRLNLFHAVILVLTPILFRIHMTMTFRQSIISALLHPLGVLVLLAVQWYAAARHWFGAPVGWKGRPLPA